MTIYSHHAATTPKEWLSVVAKFPEANFLQSWQWGDAYASTNSTVVRYIISDGSTVLGGFQAIIHNAKRGRYMAVPGGPLIDWDNKSLASYTIDTMKRIGRDHGCVFVRFRPQDRHSDELKSWLAASGARIAPMHVSADHTSIIDLTHPLDDILASMRRQTRYEVRRSTKRDITIDTATDAESLETFIAQQIETASRQKFIPSPPQFLRAVQQSFGDSLKIYTASKDGDPLNYALIIVYGQEADYFEAASTDAARREPGAYGLIWQALQDAKSAGITRFNLWGIAPNDNPHHRYAGVTTFKRGFGGDDVHYIDSHDLVLRPLHYRLNFALETYRKKRRKL